MQIQVGGKEREGKGGDSLEEKKNFPNFSLTFHHSTKV